MCEALSRKRSRESGVPGRMSRWPGSHTAVIASRPGIVQHAIWLYLRFTLSYRDVEELLGERGLDVSYERCGAGCLKFGPLIARKLRQGRPRPSAQWHLDKMVVRNRRETNVLVARRRPRGEVLFSVGARRERHSG